VLGLFFSTRCARTTRTTRLSTFVSVKMFGLPGSVRATTYLPAGSVRSLRTNEKGICTSIRSWPWAFAIPGATVVTQMKRIIVVTSCFNMRLLRLRLNDPLAFTDNTLEAVERLQSIGSGDREFRERRTVSSLEATSGLGLSLSEPCTSTIH